MKPLLLLAIILFMVYVMHTFILTCESSPHFSSESFRGGGGGHGGGGGRGGWSMGSAGGWSPYSYYSYYPCEKEDCSTPTPSITAKS